MAQFVKSNNPSFCKSHDFYHVDMEKKFSDIIWDKNSEKPVTARECFDECAREIIALIEGEGGE